MKEHPIIMSTPMVQALLEGRKTMTRRIIKSSRHQRVAGFRINSNLDGSCKWPENIDEDERGLSGEINIKCPYGKVGDVLWVKEAMREKPNTGMESYCTYEADDSPVLVRWHGERARWSWQRKKLPGMFLPKDLHRIRLEITNIRVERLQDISEEDAICEGIEKSMSGNGRIVWKHYLKDKWGPSPVHSYETLWKKLHGETSWEANPFCWVVSFKRIEK